ATVEFIDEARDDILRHSRIDLAGKLDEARCDVELARLPSQIEWVDGYAMAAESGSGIEWHEPEGFGLGRVDHLPNVDAHFRVDDLQLVDQRDIDGSEDILGQFDGFGRAGGRDRDHRLDEAAVERGSQFEGKGTLPAHDLGDRGCVVIGITRILPFGRKRQKNVLAGCQTAFGEDWAQYFNGRSRIGRRFENDELAGPRVASDHLGGRRDIREIRFPIAVERGRHANRHDIGICDLAEIAARPETTGFQHGLDSGRRDVPDVRVTRVQLVDLLAIDIQPDDGKSLFGNGTRER